MEERDYLGICCGTPAQVKFMLVMVQGHFMIYLHITFGKLSYSDKKGKFRVERREREKEKA